MIEPTANDLRLVNEAIHRACRSTRLPDAHRDLLRESLMQEVTLGHHDEASLLRAARRALDQI